MATETKKDKSRAKEAPRGGFGRFRVVKLLRLLCFSVVVCLGIGLLAARSVYGDMKSSAMSLGHELGKLGDVGKTRPLRINGEAIFIASTTEDMPLSEVLNRVEARCKQDSAGMPAELQNLSEALQKKLPEGVKGSKGAGVIREERPGAGMVACFARDDGQGPDGMKALVGRVAGLVETGDLSKLGKLRYVFAETTKKGRTHIVAAWTDGPFNIYKLAPDEGDAVGSDPADAPRPPRATRLLTADLEGAPYGVRVYESDAAPQDIIALYDKEMPSRGYAPLLGVPGDNADRRAFAKGGVDLLIFADRDGDKTMVSLIEMRGK